MDEAEIYHASENKTHFTFADAFRHAAEPLFTVDVTKRYHNVCSVVPGGLTDPAVFNAIIFSTLIMSNGGRLTPECLHYKGQAIRTLNEYVKIPDVAMSD